MLIYSFDGSHEGFLCCLFESFTQKEMPDAVSTGNIQLTFDATIKDIQTCTEKANKVALGIKKYGSISLLNRLFRVFRSYDSSKFTIAFCVAHKCLEKRQDISFNYADPDVLMFNDLIRKISNEVHLFHGFIRFEESIDNILYAHFEPDNDIVDLVAPHFLNRFRAKFILHDVKRNRLCLCDGNNLFTMYGNGPLTVYLSPKEMEMKNLWKTYYQSINIPQRKNIRQMTAYMPTRYHKYLPEKSELDFL